MEQSLGYLLLHCTSEMLFIKISLALHHQTDWNDHHAAQSFAFPQYQPLLCTNHAV